MAKKDADKTAKKVGTPFKSGEEWNGNAKGRPLGSRNKLGEDFLADMLSAWQKFGKAVIEEVIKDRPQDYLKVVAGILPKEMNIKRDALDELSEDELATILATVRTQITAALRANGLEETAEETRH